MIRLSFYKIKKGEKKRKKKKKKLECRLSCGFSFVEQGGKEEGERKKSYSVKDASPLISILSITSVKRII